MVSVCHSFNLIAFATQLFLRTNTCLVVLWFYCLFCSFSSTFLFVGEKLALDSFKDGIIPRIKINYRIKFFISVTLNSLRDKEKPQ